MAAFAAQQPQINPANPNNDILLNDPPADSISALSFSPRANFLIASAWNNEVRCYQVNPDGSTQGKALQQYGGPVLCSTWGTDGATVYSGVCDKSVQRWDMNTSQSTQIGQHDAPIKDIAYIESMNCVATGSWDKTIRYWDMRTPNPVCTVNLPERVYAMDVNHPLMVVATADRQVLVFNLANPQTVFRTIPSPLKMQSRCITCFPDKTGFALGSIEGRVAIHYVDEKDSGKNFAFKCHRENRPNGTDVDVYPVNAIKFHHGYGTFATCGSDGVFNFWDKENRQRLKPFNKCAAPITAAAFNMDGNIFAYACSYDWSKGHEGYNRNPPQIFLHSCAEDIKPKPKQQQGARR